MRFISQLRLFLQSFTLSTSSSTTPPHSVWLPLSPANAQPHDKDTSLAWTSSCSYQKSSSSIYPIHPSVADTIFCCPEIQRKCLLAIIFQLYWNCMQEHLSWLDWVNGESGPHCYCHCTPFGLWNKREFQSKEKAWGERVECSGKSRSKNYFPEGLCSLISI